MGTDGGDYFLVDFVDVGLVLHSWDDGIIINNKVEIEINCYLLLICSIM